MVKNSVRIFNYPGVWSIVWYRIAHRLYRLNYKRIARMLMGINQFFNNIDIHPAARIGRRVFIDHGIGVVIGETCILEDDVVIYQDVTLGGVNLSVGKRHPTVRRGTIIGVPAYIFKRVAIQTSLAITSYLTSIKSCLSIFLNASLF